MIIEDIYLYVCKRKFTDKVIVAHARVMEETKAIYPFKHSEYNGNKGNTEVTIENPTQKTMYNHEHITPIIWKKNFKISLEE